jgi:serine/threonine-protein kinase
VTLKKGSVTVLIEVEPPPQAIFVDGKPWTGDPKKIDGLSGEEEHKIAVSSSGYVPKTFTFEAKQGETLTFKHAMVRADPRAASAERDPPKGGGAAPSKGTGTVRVGAKGGFCSVTINGASYGPTPTQATVPAGTARVTCTPEGGGAMSQSVQVEAGGTARVGFVIP